MVNRHGHRPSVRKKQKAMLVKPSVFDKISDYFCSLDGESVFVGLFIGAMVMGILGLFIII